MDESVKNKQRRVDETATPRMNDSHTNKVNIGVYYYLDPPKRLSTSQLVIVLSISYTSRIPFTTTCSTSSGSISISISLYFLDSFTQYRAMNVSRNTRKNCAK